MASIRKFEDIVAWQEARAVSREVYALTRLAGFSSDYDLRSQIRDAANSMMANIVSQVTRLCNV